MQSKILVQGNQPNNFFGIVKYFQLKCGSTFQKQMSQIIDLFNEKTKYYLKIYNLYWS